MISGQAANVPHASLEIESVPARNLFYGNQAGGSSASVRNTSSKTLAPLVINSASMERYQALTRELFSSHKNVRNFKSTFAMNCSKFETRIPLPEPVG
jgi:hypothetical protein